MTCDYVEDEGRYYGNHRCGGEEVVEFDVFDKESDKWHVVHLCAEHRKYRKSMTYKRMEEILAEFGKC